MLSQRISSGCWKEIQQWAAAHVSFVYMLYHMDVIRVPKGETFSAKEAVFLDDGDAVASMAAEAAFTLPRVRKTPKIFELERYVS